MTESERRYRELIRTSPAPINIFDASGEIIWGNDAVVDLLGLGSQDELVGRSIFEFIHPDDRYTANSELTAIVDEKEPTGPTMMRLTPSEGEERTIRVATAPGQYEGEDIGQAVVIDVTELNRLKNELKKERKLVETALDTIEDVFYVLDNAGNLERWNDALLGVSGYTREELRTMDVEDFFIETHTDRVSDSISRAFVNGSDAIEAVVRTKSGEQIPYEFRKQRLVKDESVIGLVGIGRDITRQKSREQHLKAVDYLLQHQLRNQLNIIQGNADMLAEEYEEAGSQRISTIHESTDKMLSLFDHHRDIVTQILLRKDRERIDIMDALDELLTDFKEEHPHAELDLAGPTSVPVIAIPYIEQAFRELVWNGLKHNTAETPTVSITVTAESTPITILLTDNGPPISRFEYEFIEEPKALDSTSHPTELGLWAANLAVRYSGGTFTITEGTEDGNEILVELPSPITDWKG
ncbi:MAG: PAS domain-containing sensor histidine kinase [Halorubrum sp.]